MGHGDVLASSNMRRTRASQTRATFGSKGTCMGVLGGVDSSHAMTCFVPLRVATSTRHRAPM